MTIKFLRLEKSAEGQTTIGAGDHVKIVPELLGGAVPGFRVDGPGPICYFIPSSNVLKAVVEPDHEPASVAMPEPRRLGRPPRAAE